MVSQAGFEPATYPLGGDCAIQLCHWDIEVPLYKDIVKKILSSHNNHDNCLKHRLFILMACLNMSHIIVVSHTCDNSNLYFDISISCL